MEDSYLCQLNEEKNIVKEEQLITLKKTGEDRSFISTYVFIPPNTNDALIPPKAKLLVNTVRGCDEQLVTECAGDHGWPTHVGKFEPDVVERALGEFEGAAGTPEKVVPQLGVVAHQFEQFW